MTIRWEDMTREQQLYAMQIANAESGYENDAWDMGYNSAYYQRWMREQGIILREFEYATHAEYDAFNAGLLE